MSITSIQWCDRNWPYQQGCSRKDTGCKNCYAAVIANIRANNSKVPQYTPEIAEWDGHLNLHIPGLIEPLLRKKGASWFPSMTDPFHEECPDEWIALAFCVMALSPQHQFLILTKRPERIQQWLDSRAGHHVKGGVIGDHLYWVLDIYTATLHEITCRSPKLTLTCPNYDPYTTICQAAQAWDKEGKIWSNRHHNWPLPNVALGTSIATQSLAEARMPIMHELHKQGWKTFISAEPLVEEVNLHLDQFPCDQVIVGGESGHGARLFHLDWARAIVRQCQGAGVKCFVKQLGKRPVDQDDMESVDDDAVYRVALKDSKGGDISEWPVELRVRQPLF